MCVMGLATRKKGKEYRKEATYKYALLKARVCQVFCVSFEKIFWGGNPPRSYTWILSRVNSLK